MAENSRIPRTRSNASESTSSSPDPQNPPPMNWPQNPHPQNPSQIPGGAMGGDPPNTLHAQAKQFLVNLNGQDVLVLTYGSYRVAKDILAATEPLARYVANEVAYVARCHYELARCVANQVPDVSRDTYEVARYVANKVPDAARYTYEVASYVANKVPHVARCTYEAAKTYVPVALETVSGAVGETVTSVAAAVGVTPPVLCVLAAGLAVVGIAGFFLWRKNRNAQRN